MLLLCCLCSQNGALRQACPDRVGTVQGCFMLRTKMALLQCMRPLWLTWPALLLLHQIVHLAMLVSCMLSAPTTCRNMEPLRCKSQTMLHCLVWLRRARHVNRRECSGALLCFPCPAAPGAGRTRGGSRWRSCPRIHHLSLERCPQGAL